LGLIAHSARGGQYAGAELRRLLEQRGFEQSMSRADATYDFGQIHIGQGHRAPTTLSVGSRIIQIDTDGPKQNPLFPVYCDGGAWKDRE